MEVREIMSAQQVAEFLGYSVGYIYILVHEGRIPYYKPNGGKLFFFRSEIIEYIKTKHYRR